MKTMTFKQLEGACEKEFHANTFDEIATMSKQHGIEMLRKGDEMHLKAMNEMQEIMSSPEAINKWMEHKRREFQELPRK